MHEHSLPPAGLCPRSSPGRWPIGGGMRAAAFCLLHMPLLLASDFVTSSACAQWMHPAHTPASAHQASSLPQLKAVTTVSPGMQGLRQTEQDVAAVRDMTAEEVRRTPGVMSVCQQFESHRGVPDERGCWACCSPPMTCLSDGHTISVSSHCGVWLCGSLVNAQP